MPMGCATYDHVSERLLDGISTVLLRIGAEADALLPTLPALIGKALKGDLDAAGDASILILAQARAKAMSPFDAVPLADLFARQANARDTAPDNLRVAAVCSLKACHARALGNEGLAAMHEGESFFMAECAAAKGDQSVEVLLTAMAEALSPQAVQIARDLSNAKKGG